MNPRSLKLRILFGLAVLIVPAGIALLYDYLSGVQAWKEAKALLEKSGEPTQFSEILLAPLDPAQSYFATHPWIASQADLQHDANGKIVYRDPENKAVLTKVLDDRRYPAKSVSGFYPVPLRMDGIEWQLFEGEKPPSPLEEFLAKDETMIRELVKAARLPAGRLPRSEDIVFPYVHVWRGLVRLIQLRCHLHLIQGNARAAAEELPVSFRLVETLCGDASLFSTMVNMTLQELLLLEIWEGFDRGAWSEPELVKLDTELSRCQPMAHLESCLHGERIRYLRLMDDAEKRGLSKVMEQEGFHFHWPGELNHNRANYVRANLALIDLVRKRDWGGVERFFGTIATRNSRDPHWEWALQSLSPIDDQVIKSLMLEANYAQARAAVALELYYLRHGRFPEALSELVPEFAAAPFLDPVDQLPMRYQRTPNGRYKLYSIGWNLRDDFGEAAFRGLSKKSGDYRNGDWTWSYTAESAPPGSGGRNRQSS